MKKVKFEKKILDEYLKFFNYSLDGLINKISTEKTKKEKKKKIEEDLKKGEVEFQVLKKISKELKINVYNFFLKEFKENNFLTDFKRKNQKISFSIDTYRILRNYQNLREDIACLDEEYENSKREIVNKNEEPREIAKKYRKKFGFDDFLKKEVVDADKIFKFLREKIEGEGVYVFKNNKGDEGEKSGLEENLYGCIFMDGDLPPLILINSEYPKISQIATLLHEFGHYLLGEPGIEISENFEKNKVEKWCNRFAYSFMIPEDVETKEGFEKGNKDNLDLNHLSKKYFVSKRSMMIRFKELGIVNEDKYRKFFSTPYKKQEIADGKSVKSRSKSAGGNYHATKKERMSKKFLEVVSENFTSDKISKSEASKYLGVRYDKVDKYLV